MINAMEFIKDKITYLDNAEKEAEEKARKLSAEKDGAASGGLDPRLVKSLRNGDLGSLFVPLLNEGHNRFSLAQEIAEHAGTRPGVR